MAIKKNKNYLKYKGPGAKKVYPSHILTGVFKDPLKTIPTLLSRLYNKIPGAVKFIMVFPRRWWFKKLVKSFDQIKFSDASGVNGLVLDSKRIYLALPQKRGRVKRGRLYFGEPPNINTAAMRPNLVLQSIVLKHNKKARRKIMFPQNGDVRCRVAILSFRSILNGDASFWKKKMSAVVSNYILQKKHLPVINMPAQEKEVPADEGYKINTEKLEKNIGVRRCDNEELEKAYLQLAAVNRELKIKEEKLLELRQRESYYKGAFHHAAIGMALISPDGRWKEVNDSICKIVGYSREELMKITFQDITHPSDLLADLNYLDELVQGKRTTYQMEKRYFHKNGEIIWVLLVVSMVKDKDGKLLYFISQIEDITGRKKNEEAIISSEEKYKSLFYSSPLPKWIYNIVTLEILDVNEQAINQYGYSKAEFLDLKVTDISIHAEIPAMLPFLKSGDENIGKISCNNEKHRKKDGLILKVEVSVHPIHFDGVNCMIAVCNDVTQKNEAENQLERFFNLSPDLMAIAGTDGYFRKINPSFSRILGYSSEELFERPISYFIHPDDRDDTDVKRRALVQGNALLNFENRYLTKQGETRWFSWTSTPLIEEGVIFAVAKDTTEKKKLDEEKKRILESISDFFFAMDKDFNFTYINAATEKLFQIAPGAFIGKNLWEKFPLLRQGIFFENVQKSVDTKERLSFDFYDDPTNTWFEESCYPSEDGLSIFFRSINERKTAEKALKEAFEEKSSILESIGDAFFMVDKNWTVTYWNRLAEKYLSVAKEKIIGKNLWDVFSNAVSTFSFVEYHKAMKQNKAVHFEEYYPPLQIWVEVSAYPFNGNLSVYFKDISVRRKAEESVRASNERYDIVAKATNDAIWDWNLVTNNVVRPGNRLETIYGYAGCDASDVDNFWNTHAHPEDWEKVNKKRNALFENPLENFWEDEYRFLTAAGEYAYVHDKGYIIRNEEGKAIRM
ncbi:MAG: PAS domain S-box protein, partial [Ferruginibacter sp.]